MARPVSCATTRSTASARCARSKSRSCSKSRSIRSTASKRHKSGLAMRFPRISRIRRDKPAEEAEGRLRIATLQA